MNTTHLTPADDLQSHLSALRGGNRLVLHGEFVGAYDVPEAAEGAELVFDKAVIDGKDEYPQGELDMHNGGRGYAEDYLLTVKASNFKTWGEGLVTNSRGSGWRLNAKENSTVDGINAVYMRWQPWRVDAGKNHVIRNITAGNGGLFNPTDRPGDVSNWCNAGTIKDGVDCLVENIRTGYHYGEAFSATGTGITLRNFEFFNCFSAGLYFNRVQNMTVENGLIWHDGKDFLRGGSQPNGVVFGLEKADKQQHRPPTKWVIMRNVTTINMGPGLSFRTQNDDEGFEDVLIEGCTFYESRETGKKTDAIFFNPKIYYRNVILRHNLFVQTDGRRCNKEMVDLRENVWVTEPSKNPLPYAQQIYTGDLHDYVAAAGAQWWDTTIKRTPWADEDVEPAATVTIPRADLERLYAEIGKLLA